MFKTNNNDGLNDNLILTGFRNFSGHHMVNSYLCCRHITSGAVLLSGPGQILFITALLTYSLPSV